MKINAQGKNSIVRLLTNNKQTIIVVFTLIGIVLHLLFRFGVNTTAEVDGLPLRELPLLAVLVLGGLPLLVELVSKLLHREFGSDLLAGISIVTAFLLHEYLAGALVVLMLSGGQALESYAVRSASSVLAALAKRMPAQAHRKQGSELSDVLVEQVRIGDTLVVFPHEICPVDGLVSEGHGTMDESYLTGEPYLMSKTPGSTVLSGAINGESVITIQATKLAIDSRYAKIMQVMLAAEEQRPQLRRLGDQLGTVYTPLAVAIALVAWLVSGEALRFLAVLVIATPCPLLIAIPVAIIGSISLAARRGIIIKDPAALEKIATCRVAIFDKTGTLTYGQPKLIDILVGVDFAVNEVLGLVASLERYSKHPLSSAILKAASAASLSLQDASQIGERPGEGLHGIIDGRVIQITSREQIATQHPALVEVLPPTVGGMECVISIDNHYAATLRFRDEPRREGASFIHHLKPSHHFDRVMLVSGDRESEVRYLAEQVGIREVYFSQTPEQKLELVRAETKQANTVFLGDGINDAPALTAATVGIAFGQNSDITAEAAGVVILDSSLQKVDEFLHISRRLRSIALQSAIGGMALSIIGMLFAAFGYLPPVTGAIAQEMIDIVAVVNALRVALPPKTLSDY